MVTTPLRVDTEEGDMEIVVPFVRTDDQLADFLTKGVTPAAKFFAIRDVVMNVRRAP